MKFLVVGHFAVDTFHLPGEKQKVQFGGIFHAVAALSSVAGAGDTITPVFGVNREQLADVVAELAKFKNVDSAGVFPSEEPTNTVHFNEGPGGKAVQCSPTIMRPIPFIAMKKFAGANGILINMASGADITLETLDYLRLEARGSGTILFDFHNLTLGLNGKRERVRRPLDTWRRWAFMNDIVQLNEDELNGLPIEKLREEQTVGHLMTLGVKHVIVTRGKNGATVYSSEHKHVHRDDVPGVAGVTGDSVPGCGDAFGAAMLAKYVETRDAVQSATFANTVAAAKAAGRDPFPVQSLKESRP